MTHRVWRIDRWVAIPAPGARDDLLRRDERDGDESDPVLLAHPMDADLLDTIPRLRASASGRREARGQGAELRPAFFLKTLKGRS
jgi:hypothetical protein